MASLVWRKDRARWYAYFYAGPRHVGKPLQAAPRTYQLSKAERIAAEHEAETIAAECQQVQAQAIDLESAAAYWLDDCAVSLSRNTVAQYTTRIRSFIQSAKSERLADRVDLASITGQDLRTWRDARLALRHQNTVRNDLKAVSAFFGWAVRQDLIQKNPAETVIAPRRLRVTQAMPTDEDVERLLLLLESQALPIAFRGLGIMGALCGMRRGEICNLRWADVSFPTNTIHVVISKSKDPRPIPMANYVRQFLLDLPQGGPFVFGLPENERRSFNPSVCKRFKLWLTDNGFEFTHKALRHWFIDRLRLMGLDTLARQLVAGHQDERVNAIYCHPRAEEARPYIEKLARGQIRLRTNEGPADEV